MAPAGADLEDRGASRVGDRAAGRDDADPGDHTRKAAVVVRATAAEAAGALRLVGGLTVLERAIRQIRHMGHAVSVVTDGAFALPALPDDVAIRRIDAAAPPPDAASPPQDAAAPPPDAAHVVGADVVRPGSRDLAGGIRVVDEPSRVLAEDAVFAQLLAGNPGLVARHLNKPISFRITRHLLCRLPVTPNQVTLAAAAIGLVGCVLIATGSAALGVAGLLLAHAQSILDGCDGELARVRFQQSALGEWLDTLADDALNLALVFSLGLGIAQRHGPWAMAVAAAACALLLLFNLVSYRELVRQGEGGEVMKVRWWFARGADWKQIVDREGRDGFGFLLAFGRRDFFVFAWLVLGVLGFWRLVLLYAFVIALVNGATAIGQLLAPRDRSRD